MGDQFPHCIPFGWRRRLFVPEILGVQFSETFMHVRTAEKSISTPSCWTRLSQAGISPSPFHPLPLWSR